MYYKRQLPIFSGVYRPLETSRFVMMTMGGYWPVIHALPNGHLGVVTRDGDFHGGERGRLVFVTSPDGGESWSHATVIAADGPDNRNPAFGVAADGSLLAFFIKLDRYSETGTDWTKLTGKGYMPVYVSRSEDGGVTWRKGEKLVGQGHEQWSGTDRTWDSTALNGSSPFGKVLTLPDGTMLLTYYHALRFDEAEEWSEAVFLIRSHDGGRTWVDPVTIAEGFNETALCNLGDGHILAMMRGVGGDSWQSDSTDGGYNWSEPRRITGDSEYPADVIRLHDGRLLLTYGRRSPPRGILGMISTDDGKTWDGDNRILLTADSGADHGYPSSIQRDDGTIVTVYYSSELHISRRPRPEILGIHGAAVIYRPEDL